MGLTLRKLLEATANTLSAPQREIGSLLSGDGLVDPYSRKAAEYDPSKLLVKGPGKLNGPVGFIADTALDPTNLIGGGAVAKLALRAGRTAIEDAAKQSAKAAIKDTVDNAVALPRYSTVANPDKRISYLAKKLGSTEELMAQPTHADVVAANNAQRAKDLTSQFSNHFEAGKYRAHTLGPSLDRDFYKSFSNRQKWFDVKHQIDKRTLWGDQLDNAGLEGEFVPRKLNANQSEEMRQRLLNSKTINDLPPADQQILIPRLAGDNGQWNAARLRHVSATNAKNYASEENLAKRHVKRAQQTGSLLYGRRPDSISVVTNDAERAQQAQDQLNNVAREYLKLDHTIRHQPSHYLAGFIDPQRLAVGDLTLFDRTRAVDMARELDSSGKWKVLKSDADGGVPDDIWSERQSMLNHKVNHFNDAGISTQSPYTSGGFVERQRALRSRLADKTLRDQLRNQLLGRPPLQSERSMNG